MDHYTINDNEDLETKFEFLKDMPGYFSVFKPPLIYKAISPNLATLLGWNKPENAIDEPADRIPCKAVEAIDLYYTYFNFVSNLQKSVSAIQIVHSNLGPRAFLVQKFPIMDNNNLMKGVFLCGIDLTSIFQTKYQWLDESDNKFIDYKTVPRQYILTPEASPLPLTQRQQECLALLIRGKTYKEIGYILGITDRGVEEHIHAMKYKLGCYNKSQLIEKAIDSGFLFHVPETLFGLLK